MQRRLIVMRHAKSDWTTGNADHQRPLNERGKRDAFAAGGYLAAYRIDQVLCSTAVRTRQTWERAVDGGARSRAVSYHDEIYGAWASALVDLVRSLTETVGTAMLVGHFPGVSDLVDRLAVQDDHPGWAEMASKFPTAAIAVLDFDCRWDELDDACARLSDYLVPRG